MLLSQVEPGNNEFSINENENVQHVSFHNALGPVLKSMPLSELMIAQEDETTLCHVIESSLQAVVAKIQGKALLQKIASIQISFAVNRLVVYKQLSRPSLMQLAQGPISKHIHGLNFLHCCTGTTPLWICTMLAQSKLIPNILQSTLPKCTQ